MPNCSNTISDFLNIYRKKRGYDINQDQNGDYHIYSTIYTDNFGGTLFIDAIGSNDQVVYKGEYNRFREYIKKDIEEIWSSNSNYGLTSDVNYNIYTHITLGLIGTLIQRLSQNQQSLLYQSDRLDNWQNMLSSVLRDGECLFSLMRNTNGGRSNAEIGGQVATLYYPFQPNNPRQITFQGQPFDHFYDPTAEPHVPAHEFGHILGLADRYRGLLNVKSIGDSPDNESTTAIDYNFLASNNFSSLVQQKAHNENEEEKFSFALPNSASVASYLQGRMEVGSENSNPDDPWPPPYQIKPYTKTPWTNSAGIPSFNNWSNNWNDSEHNEIPESPFLYEENLNYQNFAHDLENTTNKNYIEFDYYDEEYYTGFNWLHNVMTFQRPVVAPCNPNIFDQRSPNFTPNPPAPTATMQWLLDTSLTYWTIFSNAWIVGTNGTTSTNPFQWNPPNTIPPCNQRTPTITITKKQIEIVLAKRHYEGCHDKTNNFPNEVLLEKFLYFMDFADIEDGQTLFLNEFSRDSRDRGRTQSPDAGLFRNRGTFIGFAFDNDVSDQYNDYNGHKPEIVSDLHFQDTTGNGVNQTFYYNGQRQNHRIGIDDNMDFRASESKFLKPTDPNSYEGIPSTNPDNLSDSNWRGIKENKWKRIPHDQRSIFGKDYNNNNNLPFYMGTFMNPEAVMHMPSQGLTALQKAEICFGGQLVLDFLRFLSAYSNTSLEVPLKNWAPYSGVEDRTTTENNQQYYVLDFRKVDDFKGLELNPFQSGTDYDNLGSYEHNRAAYLWQQGELPQEILPDTDQPLATQFSNWDVSNSNTPTINANLFVGTINWLRSNFSNLTFNQIEAENEFNYVHVDFNSSTTNLVTEDGLPVLFTYYFRRNRFYMLTNI